MLDVLTAFSQSGKGWQARINSPAIQTLSITHARALLHLVQCGDLDAAIDAGLMAWSVHTDDGLDEAERALLAAARERLQTAWAARERFRARQARLQRRERERLERRAASTPAQAASPAAPALPAAAAAILARARARAGVAPK